MEPHTGKGTERSGALRSSGLEDGTGPRRSQSARQQTALAHRYTILASPAVERRLYRGVPGRGPRISYRLTTTLYRFKLEQDNNLGRDGSYAEQGGPGTAPQS